MTEDQYHNSKFHPDSQLKYLTAREHNHIETEMMRPVIQHLTALDAVREERDSLLRERDSLLLELTQDVRLTEKQREILMGLSTGRAILVEKLWWVSDALHCTPHTMDSLFSEKLVERKYITDDGVSGHWEIHITRRGLVYLNGVQQ